MKISVIVPVYNVEQYVGECIESILNQSFYDIELILINDGSKDNSGFICDEYAKKDNRIKVIHKKNEGVSIARNIGIKNASGKYIAFVDSDDLVDKEIYTTMLQAIEESGSDLVMCRYEKVYSDRNNELAIEPLREGLYDKEQIFNNLILDMIGNDPLDMSKPLIMGSTCRCLYKKDIIDKYKIEFPVIKIAEDMLFHLYYLMSCKKVYVVNKALYYYRYNELSATNNYINNLWEILMNQLELVEDGLNKFNLLNSKSKERLEINTFYFISWCFTNECNPRNLKKYREIIKEMKKISKHNKFKKVFTWKNIMKASFKERCLFTCIKLKLYILVYLYHHKKFNSLI